MLNRKTSQTLLLIQKALKKTPDNQLNSMGTLFKHCIPKQVLIKNICWKGISKESSEEANKLLAMMIHANSCKKDTILKERSLQEIEVLINTNPQLLLMEATAKDTDQKIIRVSPLKYALFNADTDDIRKPIAEMAKPYVLINEFIQKTIFDEINTDQRGYEYLLILKALVGLSQSKIADLCPSLKYAYAAFSHREVNTTLLNDTPLANDNFSSFPILKQLNSKSCTYSRTQPLYHKEEGILNENPLYFFPFSSEDKEMVIDLHLHKRPKIDYFKDRDYVSYKENVLAISTKRWKDETFTIDTDLTYSTLEKFRANFRSDCDNILSKIKQVILENGVKSDDFYINVDDLNEVKELKNFIILAQINKSYVLIIDQKATKEDCRLLREYNNFSVTFNNAQKFAINLAKLYNHPNDYIKNKLNIDPEELHQLDLIKDDVIHHDLDDFLNYLEKHDLITNTSSLYSVDYRGICSLKLKKHIELFRKYLICQNQNIYDDIKTLLTLIKRNFDLALKKINELQDYEFFIENAIQLLLVITDFLDKKKMFADSLPQLMKSKFPLTNSQFKITNSCMQAITYAIVHALEFHKKRGEKYPEVYIDNSIYFEINNVLRMLKMDRKKESCFNIDEKKKSAQVIFIAPIDSNYKKVDIIKKIKSIHHSSFSLIIDTTLQAVPDLIAKIYQIFPECLEIITVESLNKQTCYKRAPAALLIQHRRSLENENAVSQQESIITCEDTLFPALFDHYSDLLSSNPFMTRLYENTALLSLFLGKETEDYPLIFKSKIFQNTSITDEKERRRHYLKNTKNEDQDRMSFNYLNNTYILNPVYNEDERLSYSRLPRYSLGCIRINQLLHRLAREYYSDRNSEKSINLAMHHFNKIMTEGKALHSAAAVILAIVRGVPLNLNVSETELLQEKLLEIIKQQFPDDIKKHLLFILAGHDLKDKHSKLNRFFQPPYVKRLHLEKSETCATQHGDKKRKFDLL